MKVIFLKDAPKIGKRGDIKNVSDGYAMNFLFPHGFAEPLTNSAIKKIEQENEIKKIKKEKSHKAFYALKEQLTDSPSTDSTGSLQAGSGQGVIIYKKADEAGKLYAGVSKKEIIEALRKLKFSVPENLDEDQILLPEHIKTLGGHAIKIVFAPGEEINVKITVEKE